MGFIKRDRSLFAEVGILIFALISEYYGAAAGRPLATDIVSSYRDPQVARTFGEFTAPRIAESAIPRREGACAFAMAHHRP